MPKFILIIFFIASTCLAVAQTKKTTSHIVAKGETMYSISKKYHISLDAIQTANKALGANFKLKIGQKLIIPTGTRVTSSSSSKTEKSTTPTASKTTVSPKTSSAKSAAMPSETKSIDNGIHIVVKGETLYSIARANGLKAQQLKDANHLSDDMKIKLGQKLVIPSANQEAMYKSAPKETAPEPKPVIAAKSTPAPTTEQGRDYLTTQPASVAKKEPAHQDAAPVAKASEPIAEPAPASRKAPQDPNGDENPFDRPVHPAKTAADAPKASNTSTGANDNADPSGYAAIYSRYSESGKKKVVYRGIGMFMQSDNPGNQYLALYNYADMGTILKVTNLMSKEAIYVKVIGKVPASDSEKDVILKVSGDAASKLKVSEDNFLVEVTGYNVE